MRYDGLRDFLRRGRRALAQGPVALIFAEDATEIASTLRHHRTLGFATLVLLGPARALAADDDGGPLHRVALDLTDPGAVFDAVARIAGAAPGQWFYYGYNAEYLFFPFCETRTIADMLAFHAEERRCAMLTYVVDLYAGDLGAAPDAVSLDDAWLDRSGYYALARLDPRSGHPRDRQLDFFGGLRWRFEEHIPPAGRRIDRIALFRGRRGLTLRPDHTFDVQELNTYSCPWHNNLTAAVASFRTAKALCADPGSRAAIDTFRWRNSTRFDWTSRQLLDLGLMEPGQWF